MLTSYVYASLWSGRSSTAEIENIVGPSFARNSKHNVTGALYSDGDVFFQVIEGEEPVLAKLMSSILRDERHNAISILDQIDRPRRQFEGSPLLYVDGTTNSALRGQFSYEVLTSVGSDGLLNRINELACTLQDA